MTILYYITVFLIAFSLGNLFNIKLSIFIEKRRKNKLILDKTNKYKEILSKILNKKVRFVTRINDVAYFKMNLSEYGKVDIFYFLSKKDIAIFQGEKCLLTSNDVDKSLIEDITKNIDNVYINKINDVVNIMGFIMYKKDFEKTFNVSLDDLEKSMQKNQESSDVDNIVQQNKNKFDIDEILDKINKVGIDKLTKEELNFLNNYK